MDIAKAAGAGKDSMIDPISEVRYRYRLASEHLSRAERYCALEDWAGCVHYSQLAVENFAKAIIAIFQVPTWSHDPSNQLMSIINQLPGEARGLAIELARMSHELAVEHARSTYGEPAAGLTPSMVYDRASAINALSMARRAKDITIKILNMFNIVV